MSLIELQKAAASLPRNERRKLSAFLTALRLKEEGVFEKVAEEMTPDHTGWISLEEAKKRLLR